jgi:hypothetical protein
VNQLRLIADWRLTFGTQLSRTALWLLLVAAILAVVVSALSLWRDPRGSTRRSIGLLALRALAVAVCLLVSLQPRLEFTSPFWSTAPAR